MAGRGDRPGDSPGRCASSCTGCSSTPRTSCATSAGSRNPGRWTRRCCRASASCSGRSIRTPCRRAAAWPATCARSACTRTPSHSPGSTYDAWALNSGFGDDYAGTLGAANNLALSSLMNGDFRDALRRDRLTLKQRLSLYGSPGHPVPLESGIAVGRDLVEAGRYREAARTMTEVVALSHASLGDDARMSLNARLWLGIALRCAGDPEAGGSAHRRGRIRAEPRIRPGAAATRLRPG